MVEAGGYKIEDSAGIHPQIWFSWKLFCETKRVKKNSVLFKM